MSDRNLGGALLDLVIGLLGLAFVFAGGAKVHDPGAVSGMFASWGLGEWAIAPAAWVEIALGLALFHGPTRGAAAVGMMAWVALFGGLQLHASQLLPALGSLVVFGLSLSALVRSRGRSRPPSWVHLVPTPLGKPPRRALPAALGLINLVGISFLIRWAVGGVLFWLALPILGWAHAEKSSGREGRPVEAILLYLLVLGLGVSGIWGFVGHRLMSDTVAASIGWELGSPFQHELAFYHLGVGFAGLACWWIRDRFWLAAGLIPSVFLYGAALVHAQDFLATGNSSPGNWSFPILFGNLAVPTTLLILLRLRGARQRSVGNEALGETGDGRSSGTAAASAPRGS